MLNVDSLRFALTLADELHFGRAARLHFISEPQFSRRIRQLESHVGVRIFERTSRRVTVTNQGTELLSRARSILNAIDALRQSEPDDVVEDETLRVGVLGFGVGDRWQTLRTLALTSAPGTQIVHHPLGLDNQYSAILHHDVDVAVVHYLGEVDGLDLEPVMATPRVAVVPMSSPLATRDRIDADEAGEHSWLRLTGSDERFSEWVGPCTGGSGAPMATSLDTVATAVATTGLLGLHGAPAAQFFSRPDVHFVPIDGAPITTALATRRGDDRPAVKAFRSAAKYVADPLPPR